jgi:diaminohydroxyphosphoribosylaminopyrimidine deaminase/5-amino-6-(5-phosphoribosylamino)uracil reductase
VRRRPSAAALVVSLHAPGEGAMERHETQMRRALELAERGWGHVSPNPMVGAVVVSADGDVVGEGWYEGPRGRPHAEARALAEAGNRARGATLCCTLEPCDHRGATPPCTDAIIAAGIAHAVIGAIDPNPIVDGRGVARLRAAGIAVTMGPFRDRAHRLNAAFERHVTTGRPFVVLKSAASLDGKTAASDGTSRWITSAEARGDAQRLRAWADAIVVGSRTVAQDDPALTVRDSRVADAGAPRRVAVDSRGRLEARGNLFDGTAPTLIATTGAAPRERRLTWERSGAEVVVLDADEDGRVSLGGLLAYLGKRDVQGVLLEGGATLAGGFLRAELVDRVVLYLAPTFLGGSDHGIVAGPGFAPVDEALRLEFESVERIGPDLKVEAHVHRDH